MIDLLYSHVKRISSGRWVVIFGILFVIAAILNVGQPFGLAQLKEITGGVGALDETTYNAREVYGTLEQMGADGREFYQRLLLTTELAFPMIYRLFNVLLIAYLLGRWLPTNSAWNKLCLLPLIGMVADYCENVLVLTMLSRYPAPMYGVASVVSVVSSIKWLSNYVDYMLIAVGLGGLAVYHISGALRRRVSA